MKGAPAKLPPLCEPAIGDRVATTRNGHPHGYGRVTDKLLDVFHVHMEATGALEKLSSDEIWKVRDADPS